MMALDDTAVTGNEGIVAHDVEQSISNLCALGVPLNAGDGPADH